MQKDYEETLNNQKDHKEMEKDVKEKLNSQKKTQK